MKSRIRKIKKPKPQPRLVPGHTVELNEYNYKAIVKLAEELGCTPDEALNIALSSVEFEVNDNESSNT